QLILKYQDKTIEVPTSYTGNEPLKQEKKGDEWNVESGDTFDEFTYEKEELNEAEGYCTVESSDDELPTQEREELALTKEERLDKLVQNELLTEKRKKRSPGILSS
ncbi:1559_t:CDS:2, partial [Cetraspora pellucida]